MSAFPEYGGKRIVFLGAERRENAMRRFAFGREVPSLRGDRGKSAYTGQNIMAKQKQLCRHSWAADKIGMIMKEKT